MICFFLLQPIFSTASPIETPSARLDGKEVDLFTETSFLFFVLIALGCIVSYAVKPIFYKCSAFKTPLSVLWFLVGLILSSIVLAIDGDDIFSTAFVRDIINIDSGVVYLVLLPPLLYEGSMGTDGMKFRLLGNVSVYLATFGVIFTAILLGLGLKLISPSFTWSESFLFGSILSSTDPVAVISVLKEMNCPGKLMAIFEGESLLNDGTSVIIYQVFELIAAHSEPSGLDIFTKIIYLVVGSPLAGVVFAVIASSIARLFSGFSSIKSLWLIICNSAAFWISDRKMGVSGPLVSVIYGLTIKFWGYRAFEPHELEVHHHLIRNLSLISEMLIFELSGAIVASLLWTGPQFSAGEILRNAFFSFIFMTVVRAILIHGSHPLLKKMSPFNITRKECVLLWCGGLRGAIVLALTLMTQQNIELSEHFRYTLPLVIATTVGFCLVIQGQFFGVIFLCLSPYPSSSWEIQHAEGLFTDLDECFEKSLYSQYNSGGLIGDGADTFGRKSTAVDLLLELDDSGPDIGGRIAESKAMAEKIKEDREFSFCLNSIQYGASIRHWLPIYNAELQRRDMSKATLVQRAIDVVPRFEDFRMSKRGPKYKKQSPEIREAIENWLEALRVGLIAKPWKVIGVQEDPEENASFILRVSVVPCDRLPFECHDDYLEEVVSVPVSVPAHESAVHEPITLKISEERGSMIVASENTEHDVILNVIRLVSEDYVEKFTHSLLTQSAHQRLYDSAERMVCFYETLKEYPNDQQLISQRSFNFQWKKLKGRLNLTNPNFITRKLLLSPCSNRISRALVYKKCMTDLHIVLNYFDTMERIIFSSGGDLLKLIGDRSLAAVYSETIDEGKAYLQSMAESYGELYHVCCFIWLAERFVQAKIAFVKEKRQHGLLLDKLYHPMMERLTLVAEELRNYKDFRRNIVDLAQPQPTGSYSTITAENESRLALE